MNKQEIKKPKLINGFFRFTFLISLQLFVIYLSSEIYQNTKLEELKKFKVSIPSFLSMFVVIYFQLYIFAKIKKEFQLSQIRKQIFSDFKIEYYNYVKEKYNNDEDYKKAIHQASMQKIEKHFNENDLIFQSHSRRLDDELQKKYSELQELKNKLAKVEEEITKVKFQIETKNKELKK